MLNSYVGGRCLVRNSAGLASWEHSHIWSSRVLEFVRACFVVHAVYHYLVLEWGNPNALINAVWSVSMFTYMYVASRLSL